MLPKKTTLVCIAVLFVAFCVSAQSTLPPLTERSVMMVDAEFAGYDDLMRPVYNVGVTLAPHSTSDGTGGLTVCLRDAAVPPPFDPYPKECSWTYQGYSAEVTRIEGQVSVPFYYRGPVYADVLLPAYGPIAGIGPLMIPQHWAGITPYGPVDNDRMRLRMAVSHGVIEWAYHIRIDGAMPNAVGVIALSPVATRIEQVWGTVLVGPYPIFALPPMTADELGVVETRLNVPIELAGTTFYMQAVWDSGEDSLTPWHFSNGIRLDVWE